MQLGRKSGWKLIHCRAPLCLILMHYHSITYGISQWFARAFKIMNREKIEGEILAEVAKFPAHTKDAQLRHFHYIPTDNDKFICPLSN